MSVEVRDEDYAALAAFRLALRKFVAFSEAEAKSAGLTPRQHQALLAIKAGAADGQGIAVGDLARHLLIRHNSAVELTDRLASCGYVERVQDASDGRRIRLALTPRAEAMLRTLSAAHIRELREIRPNLLALLRTL